jgi:tetratricopeptide (TPR) repeat protein
MHALPPFGYGPRVLGVWLSLWLAAAPIENDPAFRAARARYDDFEFDDARARFAALLKRKLDDPTRARVLVWIGMCDAENGALADAAEAFEDAARHDPDVEPLPSMSPKARRMLDEARVRVRRSTGVDDEPVAAAVDAAPERSASDDAPPGAAANDGVEPPPPAAGTIAPLAVVGGSGLAASAVVAGAGAVLGAWAQDTYAAADAAASAEDAHELYADAGRFATFANVAFVAASVAAVAGGACLLVALLDDPPPPPPSSGGQSR